MKKMNLFTMLFLYYLTILLTACSQVVAGGVGTVGREAAAGIYSVIPQSWVELKPGHFMRDPYNDPTLLALGVLEGISLQDLATEWQLPEDASSFVIEGLEWQLRHTELAIPELGTLFLETAASETDGRVNLVLLVAPIDEHERLQEQLIEPVLQAFSPEEILDMQEAVQVGETLEPSPMPVDSRVRSADGMVMVYVPAGKFEMGNEGVQWVWNGNLSTGDLGFQVYIDESPQHSVYLDPYWIDQTEVTVGMFRGFVESTGYETISEREGWGSPWTDGPIEKEWPHLPGTNWLRPHGPDSLARDDHPVVQVTWEDAAAYCEWVGGSLPSEAQWEKAARGTDARLYPWGQVYDGNIGNFCDDQCPVKRWSQDSYDDGYALTAPVGMFPIGASPYGALDMAGNVWEWVADWYNAEYYIDSPSRNPTGPVSGTERTQRGGAWIDNESWVRTTVRHATPPGTRADDLGFRCVLPAY